MNLKFQGEQSERGLQDMGLMETVEIRGRRADFHRSHKPGNARRGPVEKSGMAAHVRLFPKQERTGLLRTEKPSKKLKYMRPGVGQ